MPLEVWRRRKWLSWTYANSRFLRKNLNWKEPVVEDDDDDNNDDDNDNYDDDFNDDDDDEDYNDDDDDEDYDEDYNDDSETSCLQNCTKMAPMLSQKCRQFKNSLEKNVRRLKSKVLFRLPLSIFFLKCFKDTFYFIFVTIVSFSVAFEKISAMDKSKEEFVVFIHQVITKLFTMAYLDQFPPPPFSKLGSYSDHWDRHQSTKQAPWLDISKSLEITVSAE